MAADFMVQQVQLRNNLFSFFFLMVAACTAPAKKADVMQAVTIYNNTPGLSAANGIILLNNKLFSGTIVTMYPNLKDTAAITSYYEGKENGVWKKFYAAGKVKEIRTFDKGKKVGDFTTWWENGKKQQHYFFVNDEYEGLCSEWNSDGVLTKEMNYKMGHEDGRQKNYYDNGKIRSNYTILNGRRYGLLGTKNCVNVSDSIFNKL
jgi:antitoxin component YwqK of YwqJK toxin-antitoxin module